MKGGVVAGGITRDNAQDYFAAGAVAVGVGSSLYKAGRPPEQLEADAAAFLAQACPGR